MSKVAALMQKVLCDSPLFDYRMLPFCSSVAGVFFAQQHQISDTYAQHVQHHDNIVCTCGMQRQQMAGDGNCCFYSVALAITSNADRLRVHTSDFFRSHNLDPEQGVSDLAHRLRHVVVNERQSNPQDYEGFVRYGNCGGRKI